MTEPPRPRDAGAIAASVRAVPAIIGQGLGLLRASRVLLTLILVEALWGFSMVTFESLFPIRLSELVGGTDTAAAIMGPVGSAAWFASAAGAAAIVLLSRRIGVARSAGLLRIVQGGTVIAMGLIAGVVGVVVAYLACYTAHGASNPMHTTLLHRQVDGPHRTTVLSMNSMVAQPAGALGGILLAALADGTSVSTAMIVGGVICAAAAPLYLPAFRQERQRRLPVDEPDRAALAA
jgi:membrane associated rhomboid family serine protease